MVTRKFNSTKDYLRQIFRLEKVIENKLSEVYRIKMLSCSISISTDTERVQTSGDKDRLSATVAKIVDLEKETDNLVDELIDTRKRIIEQIESIEDTYMYRVLAARYIEDKKLTDIAEEFGYSRMQINRIHGKALLEFEKRYGEEYLNEK